MATLSPILHFPVILTPGLNNTLLPMIGRLSGVLFNPMTTPLFIWQLHPIDRDAQAGADHIQADCDLVFTSATGKSDFPIAGQ